jgi:hypothetical protein
MSATKPKSGDIIKCDRCQACHRLSHPMDRRTGGVVSGLLVFTCNGTLRVAARLEKLLPQFEIIEPVGTSSTATTDITPIRKSVSTRYRTRQGGHQ